MTIRLHHNGNINKEIECVERERDEAGDLATAYGKLHRKWTTRKKNRTQRLVQLKRKRDREC